MKLKDYVVEQLAFKVLSETVKELDSKITAELGELAIRILEEKDERRKDGYIKMYNDLKKLDNLDLHNIDTNYLDYKVIRVLDEKIRLFIPTITKE